jgi:myosin heavy subunit
MLDKKNKNISPKEKATQQEKHEFCKQTFIKLQEKTSLVQLGKRGRELIKERVNTEEQIKRRRSRSRSKPRDKSVDKNEIEIVVVSPGTEQEQIFENPEGGFCDIKIFENQVQKNIQQQDKVLDQISQGLDDLQQIANDANKQLSIQKCQLQQTDEKMNTVNQNLKTTNRRLKNLLEKYGGASRFVCFVFF